MSRRIASPLRSGIACLLWGITCSMPALAQTTATLTKEITPQAPESRSIEGKVVDEDSGQALPFVRVVVRGSSLSSRTDEQGHFTIQGVPSGPFTLSLDEPSVEPTTVKVAHSNAPITIRTRYRDDDQVVVVRGSLQPTSTASQTSLSARDIEATPIRNAEDAMRLVPGVTLVQHGSEGKGHQFFLRGFDAVHGIDLEVTLEGIPLNEWSNIHGQGYLDLGFIVPEAISSLHATKGPFFDHQGAFAMAGSVDYHLGIPQENLGLRVAYTAGTTNRHRGVVTYSPHESDGKDFIALEAMHDDAYGENRAINRGSLLGRVRLFDSVRDGTLSILASAYVADFELPGSIRNEDVEAGRIGFYDAYDPAGKGLSARALLALRYARQQGNHELAATVYGGYRKLDLLENYTGFLIDPVNGDRRQQQQATFNFGVQMEDTVNLNRSLAWHYGASVRGDVFEQSQEHLNQAEAPISQESSLAGIQTLSSLYTSLRLQPLEPLSLTLGGRLDAVQVQAIDQVQRSASDAGLLLAASPRLTAAWRVSDPWQLFLSYGRGFRPPEARAFSSYQPPQTGFSEELYDGGEPSMTLSDAVELGTRIRPSRYLGIMASGFATFIAREAVFDHVSGINLELNRTRRLGVELDLQSNPTGWLLLAADATLVDARFVESGNPVPFAPWLSGGMRAVVTHPSGWRAGVRFFGLAPRTLPHGATGAAMAALDATLGYHWDHFRLDLALENLLNLRLREGEYHYASDWDARDGVSQIPVIHTVAGPPLNARLGFTILY